MTNEPSEKPKSNRGGKRPGAGAPKGNMNNLKHGRRSAQFARLGATLCANPETRAALLAFAWRMEGKQVTELEDALALFYQLLDHAAKIARGEPSPGPFAHLQTQSKALS